MNPRRKKRLILEACLAFCVLTVLIRFTIPKFIRSQDNANYNSPEKIPDPNLRRGLEKYLRLRPGEKFTILETAPRRGFLQLDNMGIHDMTGIEYFPNITGLSCNGNPFRNLDLSKNNELLTLFCSSQLYTLTLSPHPKLQHLVCGRVDLLDPSLLPDLQVLVFSSEAMNALDISRNPKLKKLEVRASLLTQIDVSHNPELEELTVKNTAIKEIDLSNNIHLKTFRSFQNPILRLDLSANNNLTQLSLGYNYLDTLIFPLNGILRSIDVTQNNLTELDVSDHPNLTSLVCVNNQLTTLDLSHNSKIRQVNCSHNSIKEIYLPKESRMSFVNLSYNQIKKVPVFDYSHLYAFDIRYNNLGWDEWELIQNIKANCKTQKFLNNDYLTRGFAYSPQNHIANYER